MRLHSNYHQCATYYDPVWVAEDRIKRGLPLPLDLVETLSGMGIDLPLLEASLQAPENIGFAIESLNGENA